MKTPPNWRNGEKFLCPQKYALPYIYDFNSSALAALAFRSQHMHQFFLTWQCHESSLGLKQDPYHVIHCDNHTFKQKINNHIFNPSSGGLVNHSPGLKYIVTKSRCTMALTPPHWNSQILSNQILWTESYQEVMSRELVKLAKRNKWKWTFSIQKDKLFTQQHSPWGDQNMRSIQNTQTSMA